MANAIRALAMDAVEQAKSGHPGMPMGMADVATVLFTQFLKFDPADPDWPDRDRFVLSAGHGSMLLYALLYLTGYAAMTLEEIKHFRQLGSNTAGHPEYGHTPGIETTTGPLGQGLANAVGMAIAERHLAARFGDDSSITTPMCIAGDGDLMEGISHEAIALAGHLKLNKLIVLFDDNDITIDGALSLSDSADQVKRFEACRLGGLARRRPRSGGDRRGAREGAELRRPVLIACKTIIGYRRADQGRQASRRTARRSAPTRSRARARSSAGPTRRSRFPPTSSPPGAPPAQRSKQTRIAAWDKQLRRARSPTARRVRAPHDRRSARAGARRRRALR